MVEEVGPEHLRYCEYPLVSNLNSLTVGSRA
jgi:hypothetical protein